MMALGTAVQKRPPQWRTEADNDRPHRERGCEDGSDIQHPKSTICCQFGWLHSTALMCACEGAHTESTSDCCLAPRRQAALCRGGCEGGALWMKTGGTQRTPSAFIPAENVYFNPNKSDIFVFSILICILVKKMFHQILQMKKNLLTETYILLQCTNFNLEYSVATSDIYVCKTLILN